MLVIPTEKIAEIADLLESGMICYYNHQTSDVQFHINFDNWPSADEEQWSEVIELIENNRDDYFEFTGPDMSDSFHIMADFAESLDDERFGEKLLKAISKPKPFRKFKDTLSESKEKLDAWRLFKKERYINWVEKQVEFYNLDEDELMNTLGEVE